MRVSYSGSIAAALGLPITTSLLGMTSLHGVPQQRNRLWEENTGSERALDHRSAHYSYLIAHIFRTVPIKPFVGSVTGVTGGCR